jgi:hypothetical protein
VRPASSVRIVIFLVNKLVLVLFRSHIKNLLCHMLQIYSLTLACNDSYIRNESEEYICVTLAQKIYADLNLGCVV